MLNDLKLRIFSPPYILGWVTSSVITALVGPFDSYSFSPLYERLYFFSGIMLVAFVGATACTIFFRRGFPRWHLLRLIIVSCGVFVVLYWLFILSIIQVIYGHLVLPHPVLILAIIASVAATIYSFIYMLSPQTFSGPAPVSTANKIASPATLSKAAAPSAALNTPEPCAQKLFLQRIGPRAGIRLIRLAMRDHYIEVYSDTGQSLVHMRFSDAVDELSEIDGDQIHRSHWINFSEIDSIVRDSGKIGFKMSDGFVVPIARSRKPRLKERGLI